MNLWVLFPESLLQINGILNLPYFALLLYIYVLYMIYKHPKFRSQLAVFFILSGITSGFMVLTIGPKIGTVIAPLMLFSVMLMPLSIFIFHIIKKNPTGLYVWGIATLAGWLHSFSWAVWLFALMQS